MIVSASLSALLAIVPPTSTTPLFREPHSTSDGAKEYQHYGSLANPMEIKEERGVLTIDVGIFDRAFRSPHKKYVSLRLPTFRFDEETDYFSPRISLQSATSHHRMGFMESFTLKNYRSREGENITWKGNDFDLYKVGSDFYLYLHLDYMINGWKPQYPFPTNKEDYVMDRFEIRYPEHFLTNFSVSEERGFCYDSFSNYLAPTYQGFRWVNKSLLLCELVQNGLYYDLTPVDILAVLLGKPGGVQGPWRNPGIVEFDSKFGDYLLHPEYIEKGKARDYRFRLAYSSDGNRFDQMRDVTVRVCTKDFIGPQILLGDENLWSTPPEIEVSYREASSQEEVEKAIQEKLTATDNNPGEQPPSVELYGFVPKAIGTYDAKIKAVDAMGNQTEIPKKLVVVDDVPPKISVVHDLEATSEERLSEEDILSCVDAQDEVDEEPLTLIVEDNPYHRDGNYRKPGYYRVRVSAADRFGNKAEAEVVIVVRAKEGAEWILSKGVLTILEKTLLSPMEIVQRLVKNGDLEDLRYREAVILEGKPIEGRNTPGESYAMKIEAKVDEGESRFVTFTVKVLDSPSLPEAPSQPESSKSFWEKIGDFFRSLWSFLKGVFGG